MRVVFLLAIGLAGSAIDAASVRADHAPVLVVPGRPGVPVVINGYDASYTIVEGDWGLSRPGHVPPVIVSGPLIVPAPYYSGGYFPSQGRRPGYGRLEVEPPPDRRRPRPAPSYYREWGIQSQALPATIDPPAYPPVVSGSPYDEEGEGRALNAPDYQQDPREHRRRQREHRRKHRDHDWQAHHPRRSDHHRSHRHAHQGRHRRR